MRLAILVRLALSIGYFASVRQAAVYEASFTTEQERARSFIFGRFRFWIFLLRPKASLLIQICCDIITSLQIASRPVFPLSQIYAIFACWHRIFG
jgi:hypothetical protein